MRMRAWILVFSPVLRTNSSASRGRPCHCRAQRSRMPRALRANCGVARKDPGAVLPRPDRVGVEPPPHRLVADHRDDAGAADLAGDVGRAQTGERHAQRRGQFTRQGFDLDHDVWGEELGDDPSGDAPPGRAGVHGRSAYATD
jgi:hypothetical protein